MVLAQKFMKIIVKVADVVALARRFQDSPAESMREVVGEMHRAFTATLEQVMDAEIALFLGQPVEKANKRNGYTTRTFGVAGVGAVQVRVPRDRAGRFESKVVPPRRRYDEGMERDIALLHLAGLSTRMLAVLSGRVLGARVSAQEVSNSLDVIVPSAKAFLTRNLSDRRFKYLYLDGTNFHVRRTTVALEPMLVVIGVDEDDCKTVLAAIPGDKESRRSWEMVFAELKERSLDSPAVQLGIMDGLPGLADAFRGAFPRARVARCWVHKARNVLPRVPKRYQAEFKANWDAVQYAEHRKDAETHFAALVRRWRDACPEAVDCMSRDIQELLVHYDFPRDHWDALRTTNPIERVNKEFKRRAKSMETVSPNGLHALVAFTALRLEFHWRQTPITSNKLTHLAYRKRLAEKRLQNLTDTLIH